MPVAAPVPNDDAKTATTQAVYPQHSKILFVQCRVSHSLKIGALVPTSRKLPVGDHRNSCVRPPMTYRHA